MAKIKTDENQLDLFSVAPVEAKPEVASVAAVAPVVVEAVVEAKPVERVAAPVLAQALKSENPVGFVDGGIKTSFPTEIIDNAVKSATVSENIQSFLKAKEETVEAAEVKPFIEIAGQVKMDAITFSQSMPTENRFISLSQHSDMVIITPIPEDGSLNLKAMKENYPTFVTQVQKVSEDFIPDALSNLEFLDKLRTIVDGKAKASKNLDSEEIAALEKAFISNIDEGDVDFDEEPSVEADEPTVEKPKAKTLKM
jgi:hypothetical protein